MSFASGTFRFLRGLNVLCFFVVLYGLFPAVISAATITTGTISGNSFCAGTSVPVPFSITGVYNSDNIFSAQLSDATGSFTFPITIWNLPGINSATIFAVIPANTPAGTKYRIRVVGSSPATIGSDNGVDLTINFLPTAFSVAGGGLYCSNGPANAVSLAGSQSGVNYQLLINGSNSGNPVPGTGNPISLGNPTGLGTYTVIATNPSGGCTAAMTGSVVVVSYNCTAGISAPCGCKNNATNTDNGQFDETISVNAPNGQSWQVTQVSGLYQTASPAPPASPVPIALGTVLTPLGGNQYQLKGIHVDALGYTVQLTNTAGASFSVTNTCSYPNPVITSNLSGAFCLFSPLVPLTGNPGDGNIVSQGFTVNGTPATTFNPSAGVGQYTIVYTVNGGTPKAFGANDPGCIQSVSTIVNVVATPSQVVCNDTVYISLPANCSATITPDDILQGSYGCYDDYTVSITGLNGTPSYGNVLTVANLGQYLKATVKHLGSGNSCSGIVKLEDKLPPTLECHDITLSCGITTYDPAYLKNNLNLTTTAYPIASDCSSITLSYTDTWHDLTCGQGFNGQSDLSAYVIRAWTASDNWGNSSTCIQYIYFKRKHVSDVLFPADVTVSCTNPVTNPTITGTPYIKDFGINIPLYPNNTFCELQAAYADQNLPVCDGTHKILRTWTLLDWCLPTTPFPPTQNPLYYIQVITVMDNTGPIITCPSNLTVTTDPFQCCATTDLPDVVVSDNCSRINSAGAKITTYDPYTGNQTGIYSVNGNLTTFPGNNLWNPDTLAAMGLTPCLPQGTHTVEYAATDDCGNSSTCTFRLTVRDYIPPVAVCDQVTTVAIGVDDPSDCYTSASGCDGAGVTWVKAKTFDDGSYDNCNHLHFTVRRMPPYSPCIQNLDGCEQPTATSEQDSIKFYCCEVGTTQTVILRAYQVDDDGVLMNGADGTPLFNECMVQVTVQDKFKPICVSPPNLTVSCENFDPSLWVYGKAAVYDNCCLDTTKIYLGQCGLTHSANYTQFDTVCNRGTIIRTFRAFDCHGQSSLCTQRIVVNYNQNYFIHFPDDKIITICDGTGTYGEPSFFGKDCELLGVSFEDQVFTVVPDACFKIERTWTIINWCTFNPNLPCIQVPNPNPNSTSNHPSNLPGPIVSAAGTPAPWAPTIVKVNPTDPAPTNFSTFWDPNANCYKYKQIIKVIDSNAPVVQCPASPVDYCDLTANDAGLWNELYWYDNLTAQHNLCEGPADLAITGTDLCSGPNIDIRYLLFLDLDGDGVQETVVSSTSLPGTNNVNYNNINNPNYAGGAPRAFDERAVPFNQKYGFALQTVTNGTNKSGMVRWNTPLNPNTYVVPELPYGTHIIKWIISDGCGNDRECDYNFVVRDCKKPTVTCVNGLSVNIMPNGTIQIWASDFLQYAQDNCTPANLLKMAIRKSGTGTGFPVDAAGNPVTNVVFSCQDLGTQLVEIWAMDLAGNADFCETYILVQDNNHNCPTSAHAQVAGLLATELNSGLDQGSVQVSGHGNAIPSFVFTTMSDPNGNYHFNAIPTATTTTVTPFKDDNPINGVTTFDLVMISKHILGLLPLGSPYKLIAADANRSGSVTTFDIVELRKLILGIYLELPNNTSWRFVDKSYVFPSNSNPFLPPFPEKKSIAFLNGDLIHEDFVAVKVGDVNSSASSNAQQPAENRTSGTLYFDLEDRLVKAGEEFTVQFKASENVQGYQFTINLNGLEAIDIQAGKGMTAANFAILNQQGAVTTSFDAPAGDDQPASFSIKFRALKSGKLSDLLGISSRITHAEAYAASTSLGATNPDKLDVVFRFHQGGDSTITGVGFELYQNQPNPFFGQTTIGFHLPEATTATLTVYDETGRLVFEKQAAFAKGYNQVTIDASALSATGVLIYKLETAIDSDAKRMIQIR
jgi:hypothetical protein